MTMANDKLPAVFPEMVWRFEVPWREVTTLGVGNAPIPVMVEPKDDIELAKIIKFCDREEIKYLILGGGSNMCGCDHRLDKLVIRLAGGAFTMLRRGHDHLNAGAAVRMCELAKKAGEMGFGGLSELSGIPGTLGGALFMNAGANGVEIGQYVRQICGVRANGDFWTADGSEINWKYRHTDIPSDVILTAAMLDLPKSDCDESAKIAAEAEKRRAREPKGRSAGCTFKNISPINQAGKLIDEAGLKGLRSGDLEVSGTHANYIINSGEASEEEYVALLRKIVTEVAAKSDFYLRPEVRFANPESLERIYSGVKRPNVLVLMGGSSSEREISLRSGQAVARALENAGYLVTTQDIIKCEITPEMRHADVVYPVLHGGFGENGELQKLLEDASVRFVGSGSVASSMLMDKIATKKFMEENNIPTAKWAVVTRENKAVPEGLKFPVILKAPMEGSSIGIVKVNSAYEWDEAVEKEFKYDKILLAEEYVKGIEITVPVWNDKVLPIIEVVSPHGFYDYDAKYVYQNGKTEYFCPALSLTEEMDKLAAKYALEFYQKSGCRDILRVDFIIGEDGIPYALEGNTIPGCTATSLVPKSAASCGISFEELVSTLVAKRLKN